MAKTQYICPCGADELIEVWSGVKRTPATCYVDGTDESWELDEDGQDVDAEIWLACVACECTFYDFDKFVPVQAVAR